MFYILSVFLMLFPLIFAGVIIDVGLTSIYAHFGWEFWPTFTVIGAIIGLMKGLCDGYWRLLTPLVFAFAGYVLAQQWMIDGIVYSCIIVGVYVAIKNKCNYM